MPRLAIAFLTLCLLPLSALAASAAGQEEFVRKGRAYAEKHCGRCHSLAESGPSPHASAPPFRDVVQRNPSEHLAEALAEGIVTGHPDMPVFVLEPHEIEAFLAFLDSLGAPAGKQPAPLPR